MMPAVKYMEQYDRMRRWYEKLRSLAQGRPHDMPSDNYLDEVYAFFLNCHHLKDWIKHDPSVDGSVQQRVEPHIGSSRPLRLCADLCNSLKHLRLTKTPRSGENPQFGRKRFGLALGSGPAVISLQYYEVETGTGPIDALDLASQCVAAWDDFLVANRLKH